jgi:hypothetical protein
VATEVRAVTDDFALYGPDIYSDSDDESAVTLQEDLRKSELQLPEALPDV